MIKDLAMKRGCFWVVVPAFLGAMALDAAAQDPSDAIYDESRVNTFRLTMSAASWNAICNDGGGVGANWQRADMTWEGPNGTDSVPGVGVRFASSVFTSPKPPIRVSFNEFEFANPAGPGTPGRKWRGVNRIKLDSMIGNTDKAMMRDRVAYGLSRAMGHPSPRACHARLYVNGAYKGVYTVEEPVRKDMLRYLWGEDSGNLYEVNYGGSTTYTWKGTSWGSYVPTPFLEHNNSPGGNYADVVELVNIVNNVAPDQIRTRLTGHINFDGFIRHLALITVFSDGDDICHWNGGSNNHYWYHRAGTNRMEIVDWDPGASQGVHEAGGDLPLSPPSFPLAQAPLAYRFDNIKMTAWIRNDPTAWAAYRAKILQILDGPAASIQSRLDSIYTQIKPHAYQDTLKGIWDSSWGSDANGFSNAEFDSRVAWLKDWWVRRVAYLRSQVGGSTLPTVTIAATDPNAAEPSSVGVFTVSRTGSTAAALTVQLTRSGTAGAGDCNTMPTSVSIPAGSASTTITLTPVDDTVVESNETVILTIAASAAYSVGSPSSATVTIADNDTAPVLPTVTIAATDNSAAEPSSIGVFTVTRTGSTTASLGVGLTRSGTAGSGDCNAMPATLTIPAGSATATITVTPVDDTAVEGPETVILTVASNAAYIVGTASSATVTIADNDTNPTLPTVTIAATDNSAAEPSSIGVFTVTRTGSTTASLGVGLTRSGTAGSGDCNAMPATLTIPAGSATATITVTPVDDTVVEGPETVILTVASNAAYIVGTASSATVTIADNDTNPTLPTVTIAATDNSAAEPSSIGVFTVTRTGSTSAALNVSLTRSGTAGSGDCNAMPATLTIPAGSATATITVTPVDDTVVESDETVILTIAPNAAYTIGASSSATVTITDNDPPALPSVTIAATDPNAAEPSNTGTFTITRTGATTAALTVSLAVSGTATSGSDYAALPASVTIAAGQASATVTLTPVDNTVAEGNETVILTIAANAGYTVGTSSSGTVTIADNDAQAGGGLSATYYDNPDFTGASVTRTDPMIDFNWADQAPAPGIGADTFSSRWTGRVRAQYAETYTFHTLTNDGVRLWVEGELLVDHWVQQSGGIEWSAQVALQAGQWYTIQMDHYEGMGNAVAQLSWSSPSIPRQVVPQTSLDPALGAPDSRDNDGDGIPNDTDLDDDNDGIPDLQDPDRDGDSVTNLVERTSGSDPDDLTSPGGGSGPPAVSDGDNPNGDGTLWPNDKCAGASIGNVRQWGWLFFALGVGLFAFRRRDRVPGDKS